MPKYRNMFPIGQTVRFTASFRAKFPSLRADARIFYVSAMQERGDYVPILTLADADGKTNSGIIADNVEPVT